MAAPMPAAATIDENPHALLHWLRANAAARPEKNFIESVDQGKSITYGRFFDLCCRVAHLLADRGLGPNDRVALLSNNSIEHMAVYIGTMAAGVTCCTVHIEMNQVYFPEIMKALGAKLVIFEDGLGLEALESDTGGEWMSLGTWDASDAAAHTGLYALLPEFSAEDDLAPANGWRDVASIFYTSGTSSKPKGVVCTYAELIRNVEPTADAFAMTADDVVLEFRSFNWMSAQVLSGLSPLARGATLVLAKKFSRSRYFDWIRDHKVTMAAGNPTTISMLINQPVDITGKDVPHLRYIWSSSAPLMVEQWKAFEERYGIPVAQGYGSSETGWIAGSNETNRRHGTVGIPYTCHAVACVDPDGAPQAPGETGPIELGGDPEIVFRYIDEDGSIKTNSEGRARTGDIGVIDADGYLTVTGRIKDLIIRGGVNISPLEIDNIILEMPEVGEAAAVGVPDTIYGEDVVIFVAPKPGASLDEAKVRAHCQARLNPHKQPRQIVFRDALPKTDRGKMDRRALAEEWAATVE